MRIQSPSLVVIGFFSVLLATSPAPLFAEQAEHSDLLKVEGTWERKTGDDVPGLHRATKVVIGTHEVVTYYGAGDEVLRAHEVDFKLENRDGVKIFTFSNWTGTAGPDKGHKAPEQISYIYRVDDNTFIEVWGFLPGQEQRSPRLLMWVKKPPQSAEVSEELKALQGTWLAEGDQKLPIPADLSGDELTVNGDDFVIRKGKRVYLKGVIRVDPAKTPKSIDLIITQSPNGTRNGQSIQGIYEHTNGELRWCAGAPNHPRPHELSPREGSSQNLAVLHHEDESKNAKE